MGMLRYVALSFLVLSAVFADRATYDNYQVHRVVPETQGQLGALKELELDPSGLSFWVGPRRLHDPVDIMVPPHFLPQFNEIMASLKLKAEIYISNVQHLIDTERPLVRSKAGFGWTDYYTLDEINAWLDSLVDANPGVVTPIVGGETYEGRQIKGVKVSYGAGNPAVFIEGGIHAREWISTATTTYILNKLLTSDDPVLQDLAQSFDFHFFPSVNPDGYVYSHETDRAWRKTRSPSSSSLCYGADPNRNWDFHWNEAGTSTNPCSDSYAGASSFSEIETRTLADYLTSIGDNLVAYFDFHSYSQLLMFPYGYGPEHASNHEELLAVGLEAAAALAKNNGTRYTVGTIYEVIYPASGSSLDWVRENFDTPYPYVWELRDSGRYGFLLPADQIIDTAEETLNSIIVILQHAKNSLHGNRLSKAK